MRIASLLVAEQARFPVFAGCGVANIRYSSPVLLAKTCFVKVLETFYNQTTYLYIRSGVNKISKDGTFHQRVDE